MSIPMLFPDDTARTRRTDPLTSHRAGDRSVKRAPTKLAVEQALAAAGRPITADEVYRIARQELGYYVTPQRVRTVLAEENKGPWVRLKATGSSDYGNPAHLWALIEGD